MHSSISRKFVCGRAASANGDEKAHPKFPNSNIALYCFSAAAIFGFKRQALSSVFTLIVLSILFQSRALALQANLSWTDNSAGESGFAIERSSDSTNFAQVGTVAPNATAFADTGLNPGDYWYRVRAFDDTTMSDYSEVVHVALSLPDTAPAITSQPVGQSAFTGATVTLSVSASGSPTPTFQWVKDGTLITGATSSTLSLSNLTLSSAGVYSVIASNRAGSVTSSAVTLAVTTPPIPDSSPGFSLQPISVTAAAGASVGFTAQANGSPAPTYQWYQNGVAISGATSSSLSISPVNNNSAGNYIAVASNRAGSANSIIAQLTVAASAPVDSAPTISLQPVNVSASSGSGATFTVGATGSPAPSYQWYRNGVAIAGATSSSVALLAVTGTDAGNYTAVATNRAGSVTSAVALLTVSAPPAIDSAAVITLQPASVAATTGANVSFTVFASGSPAPSYQWYRNGAAISGATNSTLYLTGVTAQNAGTYSATAANRAGGATSSSATLTVSAGSSTNAAPIITQQPVSQTAALGANILFSVAMTGNPAPSVKWSKDGVDVPQATTRTLALNNITAANAGSYVAIVSNSTGTVASAVAILAVTVPTIAITNPKFTSQPVAQTAPAGSTVTFTVAVTGSPTPTIQWRKNGLNISGATSASLVLNNIGAADAASYAAIATNVAESITSSSAVLTIASAGSSSPTVVDGSSRLSALSVRAVAGSDSQTFIVGFALSQSSKSMLIRAIGPSLAPYTSAATFADPKLTVFKDTTPMMVNDDWGGGSAMTALFSRVGAFSLGAASKDAAVNPTLAPGTYTAQVSGTGAGMTLVELYDADTPSPNPGRLVAVSARATVGTGDGVLIAGFQISGTKSKQVIIRGIGPTLNDFGVSGALAAPQIDLFRDGNMLRHTEAWAGDPAMAAAFSKVGAFPLAASSQDSVLMVTLDTGTYTAIVSGQSGSTGVALVEIYELP